MTPRPASSLLRDLSRYSARIVQRGLVVGPGGNTSVRDGDLMWISPSGFALDDVGENEWVPVEIAGGKPLRSAPRPSSESAMHLAIYRERPDVNAVVHTHPPITIGVISAGDGTIPFMFPDHVALVDELPCIDYVVPCTPELAAAVIAALRASSYAGLLMRNHGLITLGATLKEAYYRSEMIEDAARIYWVARSVGTPRLLTVAEADEIRNLEAERYRQRLLRGNQV